METVFYISLLLWNLYQHFQIKHLKEDVEINDEGVRGVEGGLQKTDKRLDDVARSLDDHIREYTKQKQSIQNCQGKDVQVKATKTIRGLISNTMSTVQGFIDRSGIWNQVRSVLSLKKDRPRQLSESDIGLLSEGKDN